MATIESGVGAAIFILKFEHVNKVEIDPNVRSKWGETLWSMVTESLTRNIGQRETVRETGKAAEYADKGWDTVEQYDLHIARLIEMKSLVEACGADMTGVYAPGETEPLCEISFWPEHMVNITQYVMSKSSSRPAEIATRTDESMQRQVSDLFNIDIKRDRKAPSWSKVEGRSCFFVDDKKSKMFEAHEGTEYLHSEGGRKPAVGMGILIHCCIFRNGCRLVGTIVEKSQHRTDEYLRKSLRTSNPSALFGKPCLCTDRDCPSTKTGKRLDIIKKYGAVHGDEVKGVVRLAKDCREKSEFVAFFGRKNKFDVTLRFNDNYVNKWEMVRISPHISGTG